MSYIKTDVQGYLKDPDTGALINTNEAEYITYKARMNLFLENRELKTKLSSLEDDIQLIKEMLGNK